MGDIMRPIPFEELLTRNSISSAAKTLVAHGLYFVER